MRVISQDGNIDVAYEDTLFVLDGPYVHAYHPAKPNFCMCMGCYGTEECAQKAIEKLREEYMNCNDVYENYIGIGVVATLGYVRNDIFRFPTDVEVE